MVTLDIVLNSAMELNSSEREDLIHILKMRQADEWRNSLLEAHKEDKNELKDGNLSVFNADEAIAYLNSYSQINDEE